jgi:hypothetical protein
VREFDRRVGAHPAKIRRAIERAVAERIQLAEKILGSEISHFTHE